ncbi:MAG TPA: GlxA family transcriptional regulator [Herbaspirillum sp.]|jgi:transcriptional regulator GlxA family with amidase domain
MHKIGFVVFPGFNLMGFAAVNVFETANLALDAMTGAVVGASADAPGETPARTPAYTVTLLSETGGFVSCSAGFRVETQPFDDAVFDTIMFGSGVEIDVTSPALTAFVRRSLDTARRVVAPCTGAFVLAEAGVLDGRRATTHWRFAPELQRRFPKVIVEDDQIFVVDGPVWTSAGMTATIDLALAMVENDYGLEVARMAARKLVVYHRRAGGQAQVSALLALEPKSDRIQTAIDYAGANLGKALSVEVLAEAARLSPRQFSRAFKLETGQSPAKAVERLRVEAARLMLEQGRHSMDVIAREVGLVDRERMRRAFLRTLGQSPQEIRQVGRANRYHALPEPAGVFSADSKDGLAKI